MKRNIESSSILKQFLNYLSEPDKYKYGFACVTKRKIIAIIVHVDPIQPYAVERKKFERWLKIEIDSHTRASKGIISSELEANYSLIRYQPYQTVQLTNAYLDTKDGQTMLNLYPHLKMPSND